MNAPTEPPTDPPATAHTAAFARFVEDEIALSGLVGFVGSLIVGADQAVLTAAKALADVAKDDEERARFQETIARGGAGVEETMQREFAQLFTQMVFQRGVDNFLNYLAELLRQVFLERPEALRSSETVKVEEILRHPSIEELITALVERRVERLAYLSLTELRDDLHRTLGLDLFNQPDDLRRAVKLVAIRNVLAHNRAVVNERFVRQVPGSGYVPGDRILLDADGLFSDLAFISDAVTRIDAAAVAHFRLRPTPS